MMPEQQQRILGYFIEEAKDHLNTIEQGLLDLQATIEDPEMVNEVFRAAHSVKGGAAMLGISSIQRTSHRLEDYFKILKESPAKVDRTLESMFLQVFDGLQSLLEELQGPFGLTEDKAQEVMADLEPIFGQLEKHLNILVANSPIAPTDAPAAATPVTTPSPQRAVAVASEASALNLVFKSDVPGHLREMLALFKQADTDASRSALKACCDALERIGEQFDLHRWCELTSATHQVVGNREQTYRSLAPVVIKELKQAQEQVLAGRAEAISIADDLQALMPPVAEPEVITADIDMLFADTLSASEEPAESPLDLLEEGQSTSVDTDLDWLDASTSTTTDAADADAADDFMTSLESLGDADALPLTSTPNDEPSVGVSELNSLADLFEGELANLESPWEEIAETGEIPTENQGPDINIPDDFSDLLESTLDDEPPEDTPPDLADLFGETIAEGDAANPVEVGMAEASAEHSAATDEFADLFDLSDSNTNDVTDVASPETTSNQEDADLDALLEDVALDNGDFNDGVSELTGEEDALGIDAAFEDLGELFEEGGNADFADDLGVVSLTEDDFASTIDSAELQATEDLPTPVDGEALAIDLRGEDEIVPLSDRTEDSSGEIFDGISDPWATEESEEDVPDESALDALDELWSESQEGQEEDSLITATTPPVSAATTEEEQFSDFEELDSSLSDPMEVSEAADDIELSEAATSEALSELFGESLEDDAIATSETAEESDDLDTLLASATQGPDDFSGLFEAPDDSAAALEDQLETETFGSGDIDLSDGAGEDEDALDFDALMTSSSEPTEGTAEPSDADFDALLGDNLDEFEASPETADTSTSADLDDFLEMAADADAPSAATDLDDWLSNEGAGTSESELQFEDLDAAAAIADDEAVEAGSFGPMLDFDGPSQESDSLFNDSLGNTEISQGNTVSSDTDLLFDDITTEPLPDSDLTPDFTSEASPADFDDVFEDTSAETPLELDSDVAPAAASDLDDLFNGASPTEPTLIPGTDAIPLADTDALDDLFGTPEEAGDAVAPATTEAPDDLFDLEAPADEALLADTDALDDLFGTPEEAGDAVAPATTGAPDDLFTLEAPTDETPLGDTDALDDLFGAPEEAGDAAAPATTGAPEDLFDLATPLESADGDSALAELDPESTSDPTGDSGLDDFLGDDFLATASSEDLTNFAAVDSDDFFAEDSQASPDALLDEGADTLAFDLGSEREESANIAADEASLDDLFEASAETAEVPNSSASSPEDITGSFDENPLPVDESIAQGIAPLATDVTSDNADAIDFNANDLDTEDLFGGSNSDDLATDLFGDAAQPAANAFADVSVADADSVLGGSEAIDLDAEDLFGTDELDSEVADLFGDAAPLEVEAIAETPAMETNELTALDSDTTDLFGDSDLAVEANDLFSEASESATDDGNTDAFLDVDGLDAPDVPDFESGALFGEDDLDSELDDLFDDSPLESVNDAVAASSTDVDSLELEGSTDLNLETDTLLGDLNLDDAPPSPLDEALPEVNGANDGITTDTASNDFEDLNALLGDESAGQTAAAETFSDLDALLSDEPGEPSSAADFDELDALLEDDPTDSPASSASEADDFGELDALLGEDIAPSVAGNAIADADPEDEFSDLEKLLEEADQTLGGSSPTIRATTGSRVSRRVSAMVDKTMRVSVKHLDILNNLVGELVVNRNSLEQDQERLRQFLDNLLFQVQQLNDVGQRMRDLYERSLLESSLMSSRQSFHGTGAARVSESHGSGNGGATGHATGATFDALEMDRFTGFHTLSQEMIELIVRVRESASDIGYTVESSDQITRQFRQVTTQLQEGLNKARMVPFAQTADRLPRAVRDISLKCGKEARLVVEGRDTLIDKMILERLYDPMTHLVNNAITHGIETPEERIALGKPREGVITVRAFYQGNQTVIYIADDGAGIDPDFVKRKAISKGILTTTDANEMSVLDTYELLFRPGFSTRDQADAFAGRGVGMDVVRTALSEIRGSITIDSEQGKGTSFTIRLPLTLSISKALSCLNNQARIAFPMDGVEDMFDVPKERIQVDENEQTSIQWRDTRLTFQPLSELLQFNRSLGRGRVYGGNQDEDAVSIVVLRSANTFIGLQVDRVLGEQEIVIKQLEGPVPKPMGIAGATVLGDGRVMPIADVLELIDIAQGRVRREAGSSLWTQADEPPVEELVETKSEPTVLIVDDSITVRELLSMSFNKVGYRVEQARDGQEAWEKLRSGLPCDLVFCDIEMPRMDGLELLSRLQKDAGLKRIPIAMLTSRGADRHRQMALDLGANGYFTKPYLEEALLDAAQRMLNGEVLLKAAE